MRTDYAIMRNLHQIINFDIVLDHGIGQRTPINRGIRADFHVIANHHAANLRNFLPAIARRGKAKAIRANHRTGMNHTTLANFTTLINRDVRINSCPRTNAYLRTDAHSRFNHHAIANLCIGFNHNIRANPHILPDLYRIGNHRRRVNFA